MYMKFSSPQEIHNTCRKPLNFQTKLRPNNTRENTLNVKSCVGPARFAIPFWKSPPFHLHARLFCSRCPGWKPDATPACARRTAAFSAKLGNATARQATFQPPAPFCTRVPVGRRAQGKGHGFSAKTSIFWQCLLPTSHRQRQSSLSSTGTTIGVDNF